MVEVKNSVMKAFVFLLVIAALIGAGCHKSNSSSSVTGNWQWVESDWILGIGSGKAHPGPDTTVVLQLEPGQHYEVLLNGQVQIQDGFSLQTGTDSLLTFSGQLSSFSSAEFGLAGRYLYSTNNDTLILISDGPLYTPAGASTTLKFIPYTPAITGASGQ